MPKVIKYIQFSGGIDTESDPRDLDNCVSNASNVMFDVAGKIRSMGQLGTPAAYGTSTLITAVGVSPYSGYGLHTFGADYTMPTAGTPRNESCKYIAVGGYSIDGPVYVYGDHSIINGTLSWGLEYYYSNAGPYGKPVFYYIDGVLRTCDAAFLSLASYDTVHWYGFVNNSQFVINATPDFGRSWYDWVNTYRFLASPSAGITYIGGLVGGAGSSSTKVANASLPNYSDVSVKYTANTPYIALAYGSSQYLAVEAVSTSATPKVTTEALTTLKTWASKEFILTPPDGKGFCISLNNTTFVGTWSADELEFASSFIYIGGQESPLFHMQGTFTPMVDRMISATIWATKDYDQTVTGGRIYYRVYNSSDPWRLFLDINLADGCRASIYGSLNYWGADVVTGDSGADSNVYAVCSGVYITDPNMDTYESLTGISQDVIVLSLQAKTFTVGNARAWAAHVKFTNSAGDKEIHSDRIMYTPPGKYDTWPQSNYVDVGINDGEDYTALQIYADRLLAFKYNMLYIINVAKGADTAWFLESQHSSLGVKIPAATFATDYGIIWVNENGCYLYNGQDLVNLLERNNRRIVSRSDWETFVTANAIIGFDPKRRQIVVLGDCSTATGLVYIYDLATGTWSKGNRFKQANGSFTNFAIYDNNLIIGSLTG